MHPILLFTASWADRPLEELATHAGEWGYAGVELCCWGDHLEIQRASADAEYIASRLDLLGRYDLQVHVLANHRVSQAIGDPIDDRHRDLLPDYVWGNGDPEEVRQRAIEEMLATIQVAEKMGVGVVSGFTGSPLWSAIAGWPNPRPQRIRQALEAFVQAWQPIFELCAETGVRFACEVHPGQLAYDLYSAELVLEALDHRPEFGFTFDPSHLFWQGIDPVEFLYHFSERIYHVHVKDVTLTLNGRAGLFSNLWPNGDRRRGWQFRSPGRGGIDWESILRALLRIRYSGPLSVDWQDPDLDRDFGAEDACKFLQRMVIEPPKNPGS